MWSARDSGFLQTLGLDSVSILQKPFVPQTLLKTINGLLEPPPSEVLRKVGRAA
jgi:hypothetical protein